MKVLPNTAAGDGYEPQVARGEVLSAVQSRCEESGREENDPILGMKAGLRSQTLQVRILPGMLNLRRRPVRRRCSRAPTNVLFGGSVQRTSKAGIMNVDDRQDGGQNRVQADGDRTDQQSHCCHERNGGRNADQAIQTVADMVKQPAAVLFSVKPSHSTL